MGRDRASGRREPMNTMTLGLILLLAATVVAAPASAEVAVAAQPADLPVASDGCSGPVTDCVVDIILDACARLTSAC